jgi:FKBP-type peptidyl-prolyl cis-trans isomerase FkpA
MKNVFWSLLFAVALWGCLKADKPGSQQCNYTDTKIIAPDSQSLKFKAYLDSNGITNAQKDATGFYYSIDSIGTGAPVSNLCSVITVGYKAMLTNGNVFDSTRNGYPVSFELGSVIPGWQIGITKVRAGSKLTLYIPPALAYGQNDVKDAYGNVIIPGNSILIFKVEVLNIAG